jgi:hypothetical protein
MGAERGLTMLKLIRVLPVLLLIVFIVSPAVAQDATNTGWPVEEHCIGKPVKAPKGWTYTGTILITSYSGIHGVNATWETPHVLTFLNYYDLWGGALSPDGQWYASPRGNFTITNTLNGITEIDELRVSSVDGQRDNFYSLPVDRSDFFFPGHINPQVYWRDNENFLYANAQFSPFTSDIAEWPTPEFTFDRDPDLRYHFAPDWTRWIFPGLDKQGRFIWKLGDLTYNRVIGTLNITPPIAWKPDSSAFVATITDGADIPSYSLVLFDREGKQIETIFAVPFKQQLGLFALGWSRDNRYFAFIMFDMYISPEGKAYPTSSYYNIHNTLYIADTQNKVIINTCKAIGEGLAWSPDANTDEMTFLASGEGLKDVLILSMSEYKMYSVAKHTVSYNKRIDQGYMGASDSIIGWRAD